MQGGRLRRCRAEGRAVAQVARARHAPDGESLWSLPECRFPGRRAAAAWRPPPGKGVRAWKRPGLPGPRQALCTRSPQRCPSGRSAAPGSPGNPACWGCA